MVDSVQARKLVKLSRAPIVFDCQDIFVRWIWSVPLIIWRYADVSINIVTKHLQGFRDFVYASCNCGAMFEARRAELREQLLIGA